MPTINVRAMTAQEIKGLGLSMYTLAKWSGVIGLVYPWAIADLWARGYYQHWKGVLKLDTLGNFISFE